VQISLSGRKKRNSFSSLAGVEILLCLNIQPVMLFGMGGAEEVK
jgi:hypothetical protein